MKLLKRILVSIVLLLIIGLFSYSLWSQWKGNQKTAPERMQPHGPIAEFNHENRVRTVAISPKEPHYIISAGEGKDIKIWDRDNQEKPVRVLTNHPIDDNDTSISIKSVFFNSSGELLISKGYWMVAFWDVATWDLISSYRIPSSIGAVSPRVNLLATCSLDIEIWDFTSQKDIKKIYQLNNNNKNHYFYDSARFSVNGRWFALLYAIHSSTLETEKKKVQIWDLNTKKLHRTL